MLHAVYSSVLLLIFFVDAGQSYTKVYTRDISQIQLSRDTSAQRAAAKIIHMMREVILDMQRKIEAHYIIKQKWEQHRRFQIGGLVFDIRKKASVIKSIVKQNLVWDDLKKEYLMKNRTDTHLLENGTAFSKKDYLSIKDMARCQYESIEIDKLVHIVERYQWARLNSSNIHIKYKYPLRTNIETEEENKKNNLRKQMNSIKNKQEDGLNKLVEKLEDIPKEDLKELLKKIGDVPQKRTKNMGDMRQEGFNNIRKMAESQKKTSEDPQHPGDGFVEDDDEAWK